MAYEDYLPTYTTLSRPATEEIIIIPSSSGNKEVKRASYSPLDLEYGYIQTTISSPDLDITNYTKIDDYNESLETAYANNYGTGSTTHNIGDIVNAVSISGDDSKVLFRWAGISSLVVDNTSASFYENHPMLIDENGDRVNTDWIPYGSSNYGMLWDGATSTKFSIIDDVLSDYSSESYSENYRFNPTFMFTIQGGSATNKSISIFGLSCKKIIVFADSFYGSDETFEIDMRYKDRLHLNLSATITYNIYIIGESVNVLGGSMSDKLPQAMPTVGMVVHTGITEIYGVSFSYDSYTLGSQLMGHSSNRVSEFKAVISDGVEKSMVTKSYDVFDGYVLVDRVDLQKAEYALAKATQGDYVFHIGSGTELYDQRVYLGKIKYRSPIENGSKYKISISGQSLSYGVENPLIAPDSTDGYAQ
jgi:hypothetical protein